MKKLLYIPLNWELYGNPNLFDAFSTQFIALFHKDDQSSIDFNPDYIYVQCGALKAESLQLIKAKTGALVVQWTGNCTYEPLEEVFIYKDISDMTLLASGIGQKKMYQDLLSQPVEYWQHGAANWHFREVRPSITDKSIRFIGNAYSQFDGGVERNKLCKLLSSHFDSFEVWGNGFANGDYTNPGSIPFSQIFDLYNSSYISISANCMNSIEGYWSNRPMNIMAAGSCCLMRYTPKMEKWFADMEHCVYYRDNQQAIEKIEMLINNPKLRDQIAKQGQEVVSKYHTVEYRAQEFKQHLESIE